MAAVVSGRWRPLGAAAACVLFAASEALVAALERRDLDLPGELIATLPGGVEGAIEVPLPAPREPTFFARVGNWMVILSALLLVAIAFAFRRSTR